VAQRGEASGAARNRLGGVSGLLNRGGGGGVLAAAGGEGEGEREGEGHGPVGRLPSWAGPLAPIFFLIFYFSYIMYMMYNCPK